MRINLGDAILSRVVRFRKRKDQRDTSLSAFDPSRVCSIIVVSTTAIGDTLMSTPGIRAVRKRFPKARITGHFNIKNIDLFDNNPHLDGVIPFYRGYGRFAGTVRKMARVKPDLAVIFHGNDPHAVPSVYLAGARFIVQAFPSRKYRFLLSEFDPSLQGPRPPHGIRQRLAAAALVGCPVDDITLELVVEPADVQAVETYLKQKGVDRKGPLIGFQIGAKDRYKMWPDEKFIELGRRLLERYPDASIVLTGSSNEASLCRRTAGRIGDQALSTAGEIGLKELRGLVSRMTLLVTNDTGAMHMAIALKTPTVTVFGPTNPGGVGVIQDLHLHRIVKNERPCDPCTTKKCKDPFCMDQISVDRVWAAVEELLA